MLPVIEYWLNIFREAPTVKCGKASCAASVIIANIFRRLFLEIISLRRLALSTLLRLRWCDAFVLMVLFPVCWACGDIYMQFHQYTHSHSQLCLYQMKTQLPATRIVRVRPWALENHHNIIDSRIKCIEYYRHSWPYYFSDGHSKISWFNW